MQCSHCSVHALPSTVYTLNTTVSTHSTCSISSTVYSSREQRLHSPCSLRGWVCSLFTTHRALQRTPGLFQMPCSLRPGFFFLHSPGLLKDGSNSDQGNHRSQIICEKKIEKKWKQTREKKTLPDSKRLP